MKRATSIGSGRIRRIDWLLLLVLNLALTPHPVAGADRALVLESIRIEGAARTGRSTVLDDLPLQEGSAVTPDQILDAVDELRRADIFAAVDFRTERGSERGRFVLVLVVEERGLDFRFGTGYHDLDGWYLIPAQLRFDNRLGRGERLRLQANVGYRIGGLELVMDDRRFAGGAGFWEAKLAGHAIDHPYFVDGVEYRHRVEQGEAGALAGWRMGRTRVQFGARFERIDPDSSAEAAQDDPFRDIERGEELAFADLPGGVASRVGESERTVLHAQFEVDSRSRRRVSFTPAAGVWGRVRAETFAGADDPSFSGVTADLRAYRAVAGGALALRLRGGAVQTDAAFYDRYHLGGLYTVRGFPSQSLSPPEGDTRFWTAAVEFRAPLAGRPDRPRVLGFVFADAGDGWQQSGAGSAGGEDAAASAGFGFRIRVPWFDSLGIDFGMPITESPVDEAFHGNAALGWNF
ncbi:MAG: BamA/TamA family outer membrane protein [Candidatus Eiseniibacteriota bacterium]